MYNIFTIKPHHSGFDMWQADMWDEQYEEYSDALDTYELIEITDDTLDELSEQGLEDIRGRVYDEPARIFAMADDFGDKYYYGITYVEE